MQNLTLRNGRKRSKKNKSQQQRNNTNTTMSNDAMSREKIERALLSEAEQYSRSRVLELERKLQDLLIQDDFSKQEMEKLRSQLGNMSQLTNLADQLKRDNANLCADLESNQRYMQQELSRRDNSSIQRDQLTRHVRRLENNNEGLRRKLVESDTRLAAANDRAASLRDHLAKTMQRAAELEQFEQKTGQSNEEENVFGQALLERLEELEAELVFARAAATRTTTRYVLREATEPFQPVLMDQVHTITGRVNKVSGVFTNRKQAELQGHYSKMLMDYKALSGRQEEIEKEHNSMVEENELLRKQLRDCTVQLRNSRMQTAMKLAMQKSKMGKSMLSSNLYLSRGGRQSQKSFMMQGNSTTRTSKGNGLQITNAIQTSLPKLKKQRSRTKIVDVSIPSF